MIITHPELIRLLDKLRKSIRKIYRMSAYAPTKSIPLGKPFKMVDDDK